MEKGGGVTANEGKVSEFAAGIEVAVAFLAGISRTANRAKTGTGMAGSGGTDTVSLMSESEKTKSKEAGTAFTGSAGTWRCGEWCRHFEPLDEERWPGFGRCLHPLSLRHGQIFSLRHDCSVGETERDLGDA